MHTSSTSCVEGVQELSCCDIGKVGSQTGQQHMSICLKLLQQLWASVKLVVRIWVGSRVLFYK